MISSQSERKRKKEKKVLLLLGNDREWRLADKFFMKEGHAVY
jgi:hypothetical protein